MDNNTFERDYNKESKLEDAVDLAIFYCKENIPKVDGWSREGLEKHLATMIELKEQIGNSFVVGHFE